MNLFFVLILALLCRGTLSRQRKRSAPPLGDDLDSPRDLSEYLHAPTPSEGLPSLLRRRLLREDLRVKTLIENYHLYDPSLPKTFVGETLIYVTPWNKRGYDIAKGMRHKVEWVVSVWFEVR